MAPEQRANPTTISEMADVYALGVSWYEMLTGTRLSPERIAAEDVENPVTSTSPLGWLLMQMLRYKPEQRPSLPFILSNLQGSPQFNTSEVEDIIRTSLQAQQHPDVLRATVALTFQILPRLGLSPKQAHQYLSSRGHSKQPHFLNEDGEISAALPEDGLDEYAAWVTAELSGYPLQQ